MNGILNDAVINKSNIDLSLYDIAKCFDAQWYEETMNDLWDVGISDDKFALISEMNSKCKIAIKTPVGQTDRFEMDGDGAYQGQCAARHPGQGLLREAGGAVHLQVVCGCPSLNDDR